MNSCVCCSGHLLNKLPYHDNFFGFPLNHCLDCGHIQPEQIPDSDSLSEYYRGIYSERRNKFIDHRYNLIMKRRAESQLLFTQRHINIKNKKAMDIGCGYGQLLEILSPYCLNIKGLEFDGNAAEFCSKQGISVNLIKYEKQIEDSIVSFEPDIIFLSHALEHLRNPAWFLDLCHELILFIEVPVYNFKVPEQFIDQEGHLNFFCLDSLKKLLCRLNFKILEMERFGPPMWFFWHAHYAPIRKLARLVCQDFFLNQYDMNRSNGIWLRTLIKGPKCKL